MDRSKTLAGLFPWAVLMTLLCFWNSRGSEAARHHRHSVESGRGWVLQLILGIYRRVANSLFMEWAQRQPRPDHVTTTGFQTLMAEEHRAKALRFVLAKRPSLKNLS